MTICIAAISEENGKDYVVLATDHMVTTNFSEGVGAEFDLDVKKFKFLDDKKECVAMLAGNPLVFEKLTSGLGEGSLNYAEYKSKIYEKFKKERKKSVENFVRGNFGVDMEYIKNAFLQPQVNPALQQGLNSILAFNLNTVMIMAGLDEKGVCHIDQITEFEVIDHTSLGFHCIGSGHLQASNILLHNRQSKKRNLRETIYNVYKAKKYSEVSSGVGKETELIVFGKGIYKYLREDDLKILEELLEKENSFKWKKESLNKIDLKIV